MRLILCILGLAVACSAWATDDAALPRHSLQETQLLTALKQIHHGQIDAALADLDTLIKEQPDFRLANFLYGGLMLAKAGRIPDLGTGGDKLSAREYALLEEARSRWAHRLSSPPEDAVPNAVLALAPRYKHLILVDLKRNRLYVMKNNNGVPEIQMDFYASIGEAGSGKFTEGDGKTPVGIYHVTQYLADKQLPELYGVGAFPVNYPNALDHLYGRTGHGIWIHGVPRNTYNRAPLASQGCVVVANQDFLKLKQNVSVGVTPVVFTNELKWLTPEEAARQRWELVTAVADWRRRWEKVDTKAYLAYYSPQFVSNDGMDKQAFSAYKRDVNADKTDINVKLSDISIFRYPSDKPMALVTFTQDYSSNNFQAVARKKQFWVHDPELGWQILQESNGDE